MDARALGERLDSDWELLSELVELFGEDYPRLLGALSAALAASDFAVASRHAHAIKGMAGNLGALRVQRLALLIENQARTGASLPESQGRLKELELELQSAHAELSRLAREKGGP